MSYHPAILWRNAAGAPRSLATIFKRPFSHLFIKAEGSGWVLDEEALSILSVSRRLGLSADRAYWVWPHLRQCVHFTSQFAVRDPKWTQSRQRLSVDYFHGRPESAPLFAECFNILRQIHPRLSRIRVSHSQIEQLILSTGIAPEKVHRIPIAINLDHFAEQTPEAKHRMREELGIPQEAVVIGSFQKDGVGWGEGMEPKPIKGPDVFVRVAARLKRKYPNLWVLLTGPSRGFVKRGLAAANIPFVHRLLDHYPDIGRYYSALDLYLVTSRDEGGPKAILESMASAIPLVTTRVGQARDLVRHGVNAWMVESEDEDGLTHYAETALVPSEERKKVLRAGVETAANNTYFAQQELWRKFFTGYVED